MYKSEEWRKYQLHFVCYQQNNFISISVSFTCQNFIRDYSYSFTLLSHLNATSAEQLALVRVNTRRLLRHEWCECQFFLVYDTTFGSNSQSMMKNET